MTLTRKDAVATGLTGLAVFVFLATHERPRTCRRSVTAIAGLPR